MVGIDRIREESILIKKKGGARSPQRRNQREAGRGLIKSEAVGGPEVWVQPLPGHAHLTGGRGPGLLLLIALIVYTSKNAWKPDVFFSWSYFTGWLALPFSFIAGNQHEGRGWTLPL